MMFICERIVVVTYFFTLQITRKEKACGNGVLINGQNKSIHHFCTINYGLTHISIYSFTCCDKVHRNNQTYCFPQIKVLNILSS